MLFLVLTMMRYRQSWWHCENHFNTFPSFNFQRGLMQKKNVCVVNCRLWSNWIVFFFFCPSMNHKVIVLGVKYLFLCIWVLLELVLEFVFIFRFMSDLCKCDQYDGVNTTSPLPGVSLSNYFSLNFFTNKNVWQHKNLRLCSKNLLAEAYFHQLKKDLKLSSHEP